MKSKSAIQRAIQEADIETLQKIARCICCCSEHTFGDCPARKWEGCRGQGSESQDHREWAKFYEKARGWTIEQFYVRP